MGKVGRALFWSIAEQFGAKAISLLTQIILARLLAPEEFGILAILLVVVNIADTIAQSGFGQAIVQKSDTTEITYSSAFWISFSLAAFLYFAIFLISPFVADFYDSLDIGLYLRVVAIKLFLDSLNTIQRSMLQKAMNFKALFKTSFSATLCAGIAGIACAICGFGIWALIMQVLLGSFMSCIIMAIQLRWRPKLVFDSGEARELFSFGWKMAITGVLNTINTGISELIIGKTCSTEALGYYSQGRKYPAIAIGSFANAVCNVLFPAFAELKDDMNALRDAASKSLMIGTSAFVPVVVLLLVIAEPLVVLLLSEKWLACVPIFQMMCASYTFLFLQIVNLRVYMALGRSDIYLKVHIAKVVLGLLIIPAIATMTQDIYCVAAATSIIDAFTILLIDIAPAKRIYGFSRYDQLKTLAPVYAASIIAAIPAWAFSLAGLNRLPTMLIQIVLYIGVYWLIAKTIKVDYMFSVFHYLKNYTKR